MTERERQLIYEALCEVMFIAQEKGGYYACNYSVEEISALAEKISTPICEE